MALLHGIHYIRSMKYNVGLKRFLLFGFEEGKHKGGMRDFLANFPVLKDVVIGFPFVEVGGNKDLMPQIGKGFWPLSYRDKYHYQLYDLRFNRLTHYNFEEFTEFLKEIKAKYKV